MPAGSFQKAREPRCDRQPRLADSESTGVQVAAVDLGLMALWGRGRNLNVAAGNLKLDRTPFDVALKVTFKFNVSALGHGVDGRFSMPRADVALASEV